MLIFKRFIEDQIRKNIGSRQILLIFGPRQSGKTTLAKKLLAEHGNPAAYFNCEEMSVRSHLVVGNPEALLALIGQYKLVVLDEAQTVENIGQILKVFFDKYPHVQVIATGSSSFDLANKINEPLTGRAFSYTLYPLSINEIRSVKSVDRTELDTLMQFGCYPAIVAESNIEKKAEILRNITSQYLYKDAFTFEKIKSPLHFEQLLKLLALQVGRTVSMNELAQSIGVSRQIIYKYIRLLEQTYIIKRVNAFSNNKRNELKKSFKVFFVDNGICNAVIQDAYKIDSPIDTGFLFEQFFFTELLKMTSFKIFGGTIYFWRTMQGLEIDFIKQKGRQVYGYECKLQDKPVSFKRFLALYPGTDIKVVTPDLIMTEQSVLHDGDMQGL